MSGAVAKIAALQNLREYEELNWEGTFEDYLADRAREPQGHAHRLPARLRHDPVVRPGGVHRQQEEADPLQLLQGRAARRQGRHLRPRHPAHAAGQRASRRRPSATAPSGASSCCTVRSARSKSTIARLLKKGLEEYSRTPEGALYTLRVAPARASSRTSTGGHETFPCPMHEEPLRLIPREWRETRAAASSALERRAASACASRATSTRPAASSSASSWPRTRATGPRWCSTSRVRRLILSEQDRVGIGTFQPKDEKNQDSTELTGDINYRKIAEFGSDSRSARLQLRRRVQHRQPRHHRVHRGPEARRRVPLRPARRLAGAQDQAEEVRADRHRRGHHRPHQRGRVQEAPEQRVHGGAARPHRQDRHPVHHARLRGE